MSEELTPVVEEVVVPEVVESEPQVAGDPYEDEARAQGWRPKEEWDGDERQWRPAKEFVERGELFNKIGDLKNENKQIKQALQALTEHHQKVKESEFQHALTYLKEQKKKALEDGDADRLLQVDDAIEEVRLKAREEKQEVKAQAASGPTPTFVSWVQANAWYVSDQEMRTFADDVGVGYHNRNPDKSETEVYEYVQKRVKQAFPDKFRGQGTKTPQVEGASRGVRPPPKDSFQLTEDEERVMKTFVRSGVMTKEQYISDLKRVKEQ